MSNLNRQIIKKYPQFLFKDKKGMATIPGGVSIEKGWWGILFTALSELNDTLIMAAEKVEGIPPQEGEIYKDPVYPKLYSVKSFDGELSIVWMKGCVLPTEWKTIENFAAKISRKTCEITGRPGISMNVKGSSGQRTLSSKGQRILEERKSFLGIDVEPFHLESVHAENLIGILESYKADGSTTVPLNKNTKEAIEGLLQHVVAMEGLCTKLNVKTRPVYTRLILARLTKE